MKTKFYLILTGLLMAACLASYGQEIVSEFLVENSPEFNFMYTDIVENSDGTLLVGTTSHRGYYEEYYVIFKITPEGELIDSISMDGAAVWYMIEHPTSPDTYLLPGFLWNNANQTYDFHITSMDADFNMGEEIVVPITDERYPEMIFPFSNPLTPDDNFLIPYWTSDEVLHIVCITPDGEIMINKSFPDLPPRYQYDHEGLYYSNFGILNYAPMQYYLMGGRPSLESSAWPITVYVFDDEFNITEERYYEVFNDNTLIDQLDFSYIIPIAKEQYIMAASTITSDGAATSLIKYDMNDNPVVMARLEPGNGNMGAGSPYRTIISNGNLVYHAHETYNGNKLVRLDNNLNVDWEITLTPLPTMGHMVGECMKLLHDGRIALGLYSHSYDNYPPSCLEVLIINDNYDAISETTTIASPFTLYPNPVKDMLQIDCVEETEVERASLYDLTGRLVATYGSDTRRIDLSRQTAGVYLLQVTTTDGSTHHKRIIKEQD